jgi:hypothetical protein
MKPDQEFKMDGRTWRITDVFEGATTFPPPESEPQMSDTYDWRATRDVPQRLRDAAELFEERNAQYGNNYMTMGEVMNAMYPDGLVIQGAEAWLRLMLQVHRVTKETRYACNFARGGHQDSLEDISVYAQMASETDDQRRLMREAQEGTPGAKEVMADWVDQRIKDEIEHDLGYPMSSAEQDQITIQEEGDNSFRLHTHISMPDGTNTEAFRDKLAKHIEAFMVRELAPKPPVKRRRTKPGKYVDKDGNPFQLPDKPKRRVRGAKKAVGAKP